MRKIKETRHYSKVLGRMPEGCKLCVKGAKLVLFTTGLCNRRCWYCPISKRKKNKDVVIANEWWVKKDEDILEEARLCDSLGAGVTGGDPLVKLDRTVKYIKLLKKKFGRDFHIHLYTPGNLASEKNLSRLYKAGLDEIRFHPTKKDLDNLKKALNFDWSVGCEIPVIPGERRKTEEFIECIDKMGVHFLNLNELEFSETNLENMVKRGMETVDDVSYAIEGSNEMALNLLDYCKENTSLNVHYCTLKLKDKVQLGNRIKRRAKNAAKDYDITTKEGLFIRGAVYLPDLYPSFNYQKKVERQSRGHRKSYLNKLKRIINRMRKEYQIPGNLISLDKQRMRVLTGAWILEDIAPELKEDGLKPAIVEEYPTWDALCVDLRFL